MVNAGVFAFAGCTCGRWRRDGTPWDRSAGRLGSLGKAEGRSCPSRLAGPPEPDILPGRPLPHSVGKGPVLPPDVQTSGGSNRAWLREGGPEVRLRTDSVLHPMHEGKHPAACERYPRQVLDGNAG